MHAGVRELLAPLALLDDRAGDQVDAQLAGGLARPADRRAVQRLGPRGIVVVRAENIEFLGKDDQLRAIGGSCSRQLISGREVPVLVFI